MILNLNEIQYEDMLNTNTALQYGSLGGVHKRNIALKTNLTYLHPLCVLYDTANSLKVQCFYGSYKKLSSVIIILSPSKHLHSYCVTRNQISFGTLLSL